MVDRFLLAVAAPDVATALRLGDGMLGFVLGAAFALSYAAAAIPLGRLSDRGWGRALLIGGVALWSAASLLSGLSQSPGELIAARMAMGVGQAAFVPAALATLIDAPADARAGRLSLFTAGSSIGRSTALLVGGLVLAALTTTRVGGEWRWLFVLTALPNLALLAALTLRADLGRATTEQPMTARLPPSPLLLGCYLLAAVSPILAGQAATNWLPSLLSRTQGLSPAGAGVLVGAVVLIAAPAGQIAAGRLARRWPIVARHSSLVVAGGLWVAVPAMATVTYAATPLVAALGIAAVTLALGIASFIALWGWQALLPAHVRGLGNGGFMATITLFGVGAGPLLTGVVSERSGGGAEGLGDALILTGVVAALLASIAAALIWALRLRSSGVVAA